MCAGCERACGALGPARGRPEGERSENSVAIFVSSKRAARAGTSAFGIISAAQRSRFFAFEHASFGETGMDRKPAEPVDREARFMGHVDMPVSIERLWPKIMSRSRTGPAGDR